MPRPGFRARHALALLPTIGLLGGIPFANRVEPFVLGLPFFLFWIVAWVVATSAIMGIVWALDRDDRARARAEREPAEAERER
jgi:Protein of unknown function (DUF3311)